MHDVRIDSTYFLFITDSVFKGLFKTSSESRLIYIEGDFRGNYQKYDEWGISIANVTDIKFSKTKDSTKVGFLLFVIQKDKSKNNIGKFNIYSENSTIDYDVEFEEYY